MEDSLSWDVPVPESHDGSPQFPDLQLDLRGYQGVTVALNDAASGPYGMADVKPHTDEKLRRITLANPVLMRSVTAAPRYREQKAAPLAASLPK